MPRPTNISITVTRITRKVKFHLRFFRPGWRVPGLFFCPILVFPEKESTRSRQGSLSIHRESGGDELLSAVNVEGGACKRGVAHDVYGECGYVGWPNDAPNGKRTAKLIAPFFEIIA
jgi:hypothetical protein